MVAEGSIAARRSLLIIDMVAVGLVQTNNIAGRDREWDRRGGGRQKVSVSGSYPGHLMSLSLSLLHQREYIFPDTCSPRTS